MVAMAHNPENNKKTTINCDGCGIKIEGPWYRNIDIDDDCDLCQTCFTSESHDCHMTDQLFHCTYSLCYRRQ